MTSSTIFSGVSAISLPAAATGGGNSPLTLRDMLFFLRMRWHWIVVTTIAFLAIAATYLLTAEPTFVASTQLLIFPQVSGSEAQRAFAEDAFIEGQLEIARSSDVVGGAVAALDLVRDPEFVDQTPSLQGRAKNWLTGLSSQLDTPSQDAAGNGASEAQPQTEEERLHDWATAKLLNMMDIRRIGSSTIIEISAAASTPQKAVDIADTLARQYIQKNISMKANAARQYSDWLAKFMAEQQRGLAEAASALASFTSNPRDQFKLAELQSATDARRTLYENTLNQLTEAKQRITYPMSDATIVSRAMLPLSKARPRSTLIVAFAAAVGLGAGLALAMIRHASDRRLVRPHQIAETCGLPFVTVLATSKGTRNGQPAPFLAAGTGSSTAAYPVIPGMTELSATVVGLRRKRRIVIGVVAVNPGNGASTIASELAVLSSASGAKTLLIDAAAQKSSLSKAIAPHSSSGLVDVLDNGQLIQTAALPLSPTLKFLPLGKVDTVTPAIRLSSRRTQLSFAELKKEFDTIFVDISAFSASPDANAIAPELDGVLVVASHGRTSIDDAMRVIETMRNVGAEILGAVINHSPKSIQP
ncbi:MULTISPECIES: polysaccharide biosynthesis tyrosine autokinase [Rhizobium]|uniref:polysaccharide biosynthesis tyrosine autokinase n=1 Tax=Rhizobium TaxID=379 RepID=UPI0007EAF422|nr:MULTISPECIES: tyrosine-protein kinase domain-containing protein [Rhizobium]ANK92971.1 lipopolysaccharide biosynthesis protein [Rhizobium sp. N6212]ANK99017.1 lipopolysaccharide biosynthesis protein [Rhizobium sp. N621]ANL05145.1 lipopolysaccharide biosynthesis protein [Rhizobium esperanzae]ANL11202.1 lipopolysaccharide biosynthesis protein [Rhizobium sp. N1341]ANL23274.1 lipopolysaccharide biosynthesis protein [Rhizobium sp. N113]